MPYDNCLRTQYHTEFVSWQLDHLLFLGVFHFPSAKRWQIKCMKTKFLKANDNVILFKRKFRCLFFNAL